MKSRPVNNKLFPWAI